MPVKTADSIRADLEQRGVSREFSRSIAQRLERFAEDLGAEAYEAVLSGVAMAYGVQCRELAQAEVPVHDLEEVQRLMNEFGNELRKLDEALETLAAYVLRMRSQTGVPQGSVH